MLASSADGTPKVSIILPTYNRAGFLPQAFASIWAQQFIDWELIVVDDGSTDGTPELVRRLGAELAQPVRYLRQANAGPYAARNTGLDAARGGYIAFFDSDDVWLPHHLRDCVEALDANPDVDWVYGACRMVEFGTGREVSANTFYKADGRPRPFLSLRGPRRGRLQVIDDPEAVRCAILHGMYCGLQNSVLRRGIFADYRFAVAHRNEAEDVVLGIRALATGRRLAYLDAVHVTYHLHGENSSAAAQNGSVEKLLRVYRAQVQGFEDMGRQIPLTWRDRRALNRRLSQELFWHLGYALLWQSGRRQEALAAFRRGLRRWPWEPRYWKTYFLALFRSRMGAVAKPESWTVV
jgi:glycosyltransferase involved in cell wall biosynthesis